MTPVYLNSQPPSPFPLEYDDHEDDHHHHELLIISPKSQASSYSSSSSPSLSCTMLSNNPSLDQGGGYHHGEIQLLGHQHEADTFVSHDGSYDHTVVLENERDKYGLKLPIWKKKAKTSHEDQNENDDSGSAKWMSSKMRLVRKMINGGTDRSAAADAQINTTPIFGGHHKQLISSSSPFETDYNINNNNNTIRVCSDCNTTKTPLWRSGPRGPKTLCNACGIRQRKARRAMAAAAAAAADGTILATSTTSHVKTKVQHKDKKKRSKKLAAAPSSTAGLSQKLCFEDFTLSLSEKYSAFQRVFPQDEKEAAILLMALSCGLVS